MQGVLLHLGYDGWWEQDMQEIPLKRMSDAKVGIQCVLCTKRPVQEHGFMDKLGIGTLE